MSDNKKIVTRIAPSPTGDPHVGTVYVGLFNYALAKQNGGTFILRVEDTDRERFNETSEGRILDMMDWLGLNPDESPAAGGANPPYRQSERLDVYTEYAAKLFETGHLYASFMTDEELDALRTEQRQRKAPFLGYDGRERDIPLEEAKARIAAGEPHVLRLRTPEDGETTFRDELRGDVTIANSETRDGVMIKKDGYPTYHFANVVDDHLMGVTHVMRAEEWVTSTPIHVILYNAFGWEIPKFIHLPLLRNPDSNKSKISKRKVDTSVENYRKMGILPEALLNYLGTMGWSMPTGEEFFNLEEMIEAFDYSRISLGGPVFDMKKLRHFNATYMREKLDLETLADRAAPFLIEAGLSWDDEDYYLDVIEVMTERVETLQDFPDKAAYFFTDEFEYEEQALKKIKGGQKYLQDLEREFAQLDSFDYDTVNDMVRGYIQNQSVKMGEVMQPLRAAVTGTGATPDLIDVVSLLDRDRVVFRIGRALTMMTEALPDDNPELHAKAEKEAKEKAEKERLAQEEAKKEAGRKAAEQRAKEKGDNGEDK